MLARSDIDIIEQYVDGKYFDKDKLVKYLSMHAIAGSEIFSYCDKRVGRNGSTSYSNWGETTPDGHYLLRLLN